MGNKALFDSSFVKKTKSHFGIKARFQILNIILKYNLVSALFYLRYYMPQAPKNQCRSLNIFTCSLSLWLESQATSFPSACTPTIASQRSYSVWLLSSKNWPWTMPTAEELQTRVWWIFSHSLRPADNQSQFITKTRSSTYLSFSLQL